MTMLLIGVVIGAVGAWEVCYLYFKECRAEGWTIGFDEGKKFGLTVARNDFQKKLWEVSELERMATL